MRQVPPASLCRAALAALVLSMLLPGCGGTAPTAPTAPAAPRTTARPVPTVAASAPATPWAHLQTQVGNYPVVGADFLRAGPLAERLRGLLGLTNYNILLQNLQVSGPLRQDGSMLYITGNRPHEGGSEAAAIVVHANPDTVRVWLLTGGEEWDVQDQGTPKALPADVARMMDNAAR
ncbi:hypothetical protein [Acidovorax sp. sic0104]|uniref:hypothetical protein n=1 Tax=Acidovorax sp. sic0104 TaxID=2854784 RepID=UPI001C457EF7|nr:hypothetical protein [Acidovorax sp. sic0104]MBV7541680.1 hypothetical protein [Acidovorax sp. sic0104]